jgi:hypothetical protein
VANVLVLAVCGDHRPIRGLRQWITSSILGWDCMVERYEAYPTSVRESSHDRK